MPPEYGKLIKIKWKNKMPQKIMHNAHNAHEYMAKLMFKS